MNSGARFEPPEALSGLELISARLEKHREMLDRIDHRRRQTGDPEWFRLVENDIIQKELDEIDDTHLSESDSRAVHSKNGGKREGEKR
jgi:hypothetical protein